MTRGGEPDSQTMESNAVEPWGLVAIIMCCGLFADNMRTRLKLKALQSRIDKLDTPSGTKT